MSKAAKIGLVLAGGAIVVWLFRHQISNFIDQAASGLNEAGGISGDSAGQLNAGIAQGGAQNYPAMMGTGRPWNSAFLDWPPSTDGTSDETPGAPGTNDAGTGSSANQSVGIPADRFTNPATSSDPNQSKGGISIVDALWGGLAGAEALQWGAKGVKWLKRQKAARNAIKVADEATDATKVARAAREAKSASRALRGADTAIDTARAARAAEGTMDAARAASTARNAARVGEAASWTSKLGKVGEVLGKIGARFGVALTGLGMASDVALAEGLKYKLTEKAIEKRYPGVDPAQAMQYLEYVPDVTPGRDPLGKFSLRVINTMKGRTNLRKSSSGQSTVKVVQNKSSQQSGGTPFEVFAQASAPMSKASVAKTSSRSSSSSRYRVTNAVSDSHGSRLTVQEKSTGNSYTGRIRTIGGKKKFVGIRVVG